MSIFLLHFYAKKKSTRMYAPLKYSKKKRKGRLFKHVTGI